MITLGIIGVVAAMTIPSLMAKYQEKQTVNKVKNFYSIMTQAFKMAIAENGDVDGWDYCDGWSAACANQLWNYISPYLKTLADCRSNDMKTKKECYYDVGGVKYLSDSGTTGSYGYSSNYLKFILMDGSLAWFRINSANCTAGDGGNANVCAVFWYDVNGASLPNTLGKDVFLFHLKPDGMHPHGYNDCNKSNVGWGCSRHILKYGNMNYLK